jgi:NAD(P)H-quinone oxidoreductase subunit I
VSQLILPESRTEAGPWREYFENILRAITSTFEGLSVTSSWLFRRPQTLQYPDRIDRPVQEQLPEGYRGILEVDLARCSGCLLCARACPIDCITIELAKNKATGTREIKLFDIDIGRCMYCGLCSEACKFDSLCHTPDFEAVTDSPDGLTLHFVREPQPVSKFKAGEGPARRPAGSILAEVAPRSGAHARWGGGAARRDEPATVPPAEEAT